MPSNIAWDELDVHFVINEGLWYLNAPAAEIKAG
jgi:hypothetical protein